MSFALFNVYKTARHIKKTKGLLVAMQSLCHQRFGKHSQGNDFFSLWRYSMMPFEPEFHHLIHRDGAMSLNLAMEEKDNTFEFSANLPGVEKNDVKVSFAEGMLTVEAEKKQERKSEKDGYKRVQRTYEHLSRSVFLPKNADGEHVTFDVVNGKVVVSCPKLAIADAPKTA